MLLETFFRGTAADYEWSGSVVSEDLEGEIQIIRLLINEAQHFVWKSCSE